MLVDTEQFRANETRAQPGEVGSLGGATHADALLVLDGELTLRLDDGERPLERDTWAFVSADRACSFVVSGDEAARFLHVQVPGGASDEIVVCRAGGAEGDSITDRPGRRATVLVETDEITISEFDYGAGERGAQRHVHREHADGFLVVDGEFTFHFRDGSHALPAGTLLVMPPSVVHGFDNDSGASARCFNFHMPSFGFADYMRGKNSNFDQFDPPEDGVDSGSAIVTRLG